jgi:hypothetical protein
MPQLRGILQRCRISGFTFDYTQLLLFSAFGEGDNEPDLILPHDTPWPYFTPIIESPVIISYLPALSAPPAPAGLGLTFDHRRSFSDASSAPAPFPDFGLTLHHSRSFSDEMDDQMSRFSSLFDFTIPLSGPLPEDSQNDADILHAEEQKGLTVRASFLSDGSTSLGSPTGASTPRFDYLGFGEIMCTRTFGFSESTGTSSQPRSLETLNELNERDPAFIRTVSALRTQSQLEANEQDPAFIRAIQAMRSSSQVDAAHIADESIPIASTTTVTLVEGPAQRSVSSMSARTNETKGSSIKRRYTSLMDKLRGRADT